MSQRNRLALADVLGDEPTELRAREEETKGLGGIDDAYTMGCECLIAKLGWLAYHRTASSTANTLVNDDV